jgi:serine/threonine protein kinase
MPGQPPNPSLVGSTIQNRDSSTPVSYQISDWLRSSGVVDTYLAAHVGVAIKIELKHFNPAFTSLTGFADRFNRHVKPLVTLNVGSVIKVYDYGSDNNRYFIVVEYHKSPTLRARLENETRLPLSNAIDYIRQISEALAQAASAGVLHGLLAPESITLTSKRGALIGDIGLAPIFGDSLARVLAKTPQISAYAAPELVMGQALTVSHDLYALTSLLYEMTTGQLPYPNATPFQVGGLSVPDPANLDRALMPLTAIIRQGLAKDPAERFNNYNDFETALRDLSAPVVPAARILPPVAAPKTEIVQDDFAGRTMADMPVFSAPPAPAPRIPTPPPVAAPKTEVVEDDFAGRTMADMPVFNAPPPAPHSPTPPPVAAPKTEIVEDDFAGRTMADMPVFNAPPPPAPHIPTPPPVAAPKTEVVEDDFAGRTMADMPVFSAPPAPAPRIPTPPPVAAPKTEMVEDDFAGRTMADMPVFSAPPTPAPRISTPPPAIAPKTEMVEDDFAGRTMADMPVFNTPPPAPTAHVPTPPPPAPAPHIPTPPPAIPDKPIVVVQPPAPGRPPPSATNIKVPPAAAAKAAVKRDNQPPAVPYTPPPAAPVPAPAPVQKQVPVKPPPPPAEPNFSARTMLEMPGLQQPSVPPSFNTAPPPAASPSYQTTPRQLEQRYRTERIDDQNDANSPYSMPTMPPSGSSIPPQSAVPYNFGSVPPSYPGAQVTTPRQLDQRYSTSVMNRAEINSSGNPSSGVTGFLAAYDGDKGESKPKRKTSPLVVIIILIVVLLIAAGIGFVALKAAGVIG